LADLRHQFPDVFEEENSEQQKALQEERAKRREERKRKRKSLIYNEDGTLKTDEGNPDSTDGIIDVGAQHEEDESEGCSCFHWFLFSFVFSHSHTLFSLVVLSVLSR
jgi:hypothetical protein